MRALFIVFMIIWLIGGTAACVQAQGCTQDESRQAEQAISALSTWPQVYDSFSRYGHCDEGSVAEGYDDKIVDLLAKHWDSIGELLKVSKTDPLFEIFVLKHIDTLMSPEQAKAIIENASEHCPVEAKELCNKLELKARNPE